MSTRYRSKTVEPFVKITSNSAGLLVLATTATAIATTEKASSDAGLGDCPVTADDTSAFRRWRNGEIVVDYRDHAGVARTWHAYDAELLAFSARSAREGSWQARVLGAIAEAVNAMRQPRVLDAGRQTQVLRPIVLQGETKAYISIQVNGRYHPVGR